MSKVADQRAVRAMRMALLDALNIAGTIAARGDDLFKGTEEGVAFDQVRIAIGTFAENDPTMRALRKLAFREKKDER